MFSLLLLLLFASSPTFVQCGTQTDPIETADLSKFDLHRILCSVLSTHCLISCVFIDDDGWTCGEEESTGEEVSANEDTTASTGEAMEADVEEETDEEVTDEEEEEESAIAADPDWLQTLDDDSSSQRQ